MKNFKAAVPNLSGCVDWQRGGGEGEGMVSCATCANAASCAHLLLAWPSSQWAAAQYQLQTRSLLGTPVEQQGLPFWPAETSAYQVLYLPQQSWRNLGLCSQRSWELENNRWRPKLFIGKQLFYQVTEKGEECFAETASPGGSLLLFAPMSFIHYKNCVTLWTDDWVHHLHFPAFVLHLYIVLLLFYFMKAGYNVVNKQIKLDEYN